MTTPTAEKNSSTSDRVLTLHPEGKQGVRIVRAKYSAMRRAILKVTPNHAPGVRFAALRELVPAHLPTSIFGPEDSVSWYVTTVKLDLEARGLIERVPGAKPQHLRRVKKGR